jgi:sedoheptulokinase
MKVIGIDIGTTSLCATLLDGVTGTVLETANTENNSIIKSLNPWESIQDPTKILSKTESLVDFLVKKYTPIDAIGVTGQMHGIVYLDADGNAVSPLYNWQDQRGEQLFADGKTYAAYLSEQTGYTLATGYGTVTHFYNLKNGLVPANAVHFCTIQDYVAMKLTGLCEPVIHVSDAASLGLFDLQEAKFDLNALEKAGIQASFFPRVTKDFQMLGKTKDGLPLVVAIGDNQASFLGSVKNMKDSILVNVGTGSQISLWAEHFVQKLGMETRPCTGSSYLLVGASLCGGYAYHALESFFRSVIEMTGFSCSSLYPQMNILSKNFATLANKLTISTQFSGTREQPQQRGYIKNLGIENFTPQHFTVGILEGIVAELYELYSTIKDCPDTVTPGTLIGSGNGIRRNVALQRMFAKKFGMQVKIPTHKEETAYGAALIAMVGIGYYDRIERAQKIIHYTDDEAS